MSRAAEADPSSAPAERPRTARRRRRVCVTGASGYVGSHIVSLLLRSGYDVSGTVRDASDRDAVGHLLSIPGGGGGGGRLELFSTGDLRRADPGRFDDAVRGCGAVIHCACPIAVGDECGDGDGDDGEARFVVPAVRGTEELLDSVARVGVGEGCCEAFVLTSSVAAASSPPPATDADGRSIPSGGFVLTESHRSDPDSLRRKRKWYRLAKTLQERAAEGFFASGSHSSVRFVSVCPGWIFGPMLQPRPNATMEWLAALFAGGTATSKADNSSVGFVDVRDVAALHVAAVEDGTARGRYLCVRGVRSEEEGGAGGGGGGGDDDGGGDGAAASGGRLLYRALHWNEVFAVMREVHPAMPPVAKCDGDPARPKHYDLRRMDSLLPVDRMRDARTTLRDSLRQLKERGMV